MNDVATQAKTLLSRSGAPTRRAIPRVCPQFERADYQLVPLDDGHKIATWVLEGARYQEPAILLVHGWEDDNSLWSPLVDMLHQRGRTVIAFDLPGHGYSQGDGCNLELAAAAITTLARNLGPVSGVCVHSFGGPALVKALQSGLDVPSVALISPPVDQAGQYERSWRRHGVDETLIEAALVQGRADNVFFDLAEAAKTMTAQALFVHSMDDEQCPASEGQRAAAAWPGARFYPVDDLGHRALVKDPEIVALLAAWLD